ncbi:phage tail protein [Morganella morganii]|uniref:phage tail protein n=1 Tax=Morganella TaxID=581 RepID=UPI00370C88B6
MSQKYYTVLTDTGANKLANATVLGGKLNITTMAVGDGGGSLPMPEPGNKKLVHENRRGAINQLSVDPENPNHIIAEQIIPEQDGGWWVREIAIFDEDGDMIAIGNCPESYKPKLQEGSGRTQIIRMILVVSSTAAVTLKIDPSVILATQKYVTETTDKKIKESEQKAAETYQPKGDYVLHPYLKLELLKKIDKADITQQLGNDTGKVVSQNLLTTELGKKAGVADVNSKLAKDQNGADIPDKQKFIDNLGLPGKFQPKDDYVLHSYLKLELLKKIDKADITHQLGNDTTKVVSQNLLTTELGKKAAVGTSYSKAESDNKYQQKGNYALKSDLDAYQKKTLLVSGIKQIYKGENLNTGSTFTVNEDLRGRMLYLQNSMDRGFTPIVIPQDNMTISACVTNDSWYEIRLTNSGKTFNVMNRKGGVLVTMVFVSV